MTKQAKECVQCVTCGRMWRMMRCTRVLVNSLVPTFVSGAVIEQACSREQRDKHIYSQSHSVTNITKAMLVIQLVPCVSIYTTLHHTTLHYTTPHHTTLHTTPHYTTLHHTTLHYTTPHHTTPHYTTLHYTTPHYTTPHHTTLHYTTLHHSNWYSFLPDPHVTQGVKIAQEALVA